MKNQVNEWIHYAGIDLLSAKKLLEEKNLTTSVAFHCHQAIEKSFKAVLEHIDQRIPKIHDLEKLFGLLMENNISIQLDEDLLDQINDVYIDARYPGGLGLIPEGHPSIQTVKRFFSYANDVFKKVKRLLEDAK